MGPKIWDVLPSKLRNIENIGNLKTEIKTGSLIIVHAGCVRFISKA